MKVYVVSKYLKYSIVQSYPVYTYIGPQGVVTRILPYIQWVPNDTLFVIIFQWLAELYMLYPFAPTVACMNVNQHKFDL